MFNQGREPAKIISGKPVGRDRNIARLPRQQAESRGAMMHRKKGIAAWISIKGAVIIVPEIISQHPPATIGSQMRGNVRQQVVHTGINMRQHRCAASRRKVRDRRIQRLSRHHSGKIRAKYFDFRGCAIAVPNQTARLGRAARGKGTDLHDRHIVGIGKLDQGKAPVCRRRTKIDPKSPLITGDGHPGHAGRRSLGHKIADHLLVGCGGRGTQWHQRKQAGQHQ